MHPTNGPMIPRLVGLLTTFTVVVMIVVCGSAWPTPAAATQADALQVGWFYQLRADAVPPGATASAARRVISAATFSNTIITSACDVRPVVLAGRRYRVDQLATITLFVEPLVLTWSSDELTFPRELNAGQNLPYDHKFLPGELIDHWPPAPWGSDR